MAHWWQIDGTLYANVSNQKPLLCQWTSCILTQMTPVKSRLASFLSFIIYSSVVVLVLKGWLTDDGTALQHTTLDRTFGCRLVTSPYMSGFWYVRSDGVRLSKGIREQGDKALLLSIYFSSTKCMIQSEKNYKQKYWYKWERKDIYKWYMYN